MGDKFPFVTKIRDVGHNKWGMWFEMDMDFVGRVLATIRTRGIRIPSKALEETQNERQAHIFYFFLCVCLGDF